MSLFLLCVASMSNITVWFVSISAISNAIGSGFSERLPGSHAYTDCNTINAFAGKEKLKSWKLLQKEEKYEEAFSPPGTEEKVKSLFDYSILFGLLHI